VPQCEARRDSEPLMSDALLKVNAAHSPSQLIDGPEPGNGVRARCTCIVEVSKSVIASVATSKC
jgi:hypothetical protein